MLSVLTLQSDTAYRAATLGASVSHLLVGLMSVDDTAEALDLLLKGSKIFLCFLLIMRHWLPANCLESGHGFYRSQ